MYSLDAKPIINSFSKGILPFFIVFFILVFNQGYAISHSAESLTLTPANTIIVIPSTTDEYWIKQSALMMNKWLLKSFAVDHGFTIFLDNEIPSSYSSTIISIGNTSLPKPVLVTPLEKYEFCIASKGQVVSLLAQDPSTLCRATGAFLKKYAGVIFYMPGDLFTSFRKIDKIEVLVSDVWREKSLIEYVSATGFNFELQGEPFFKQVNGLYHKDWGNHQHTLAAYFPAEKFLVKYPEIYPLVDGKRQVPKSAKDQKWQPDFAAPQLIEAALEVCISYFKNNPGIDHIAFSVMDGKVYPKKGLITNYLSKTPSTKEGQARAYSNAYIDFINALAIRLPIELKKHSLSVDKTIVYLVYGYVGCIPEKKLMPNVLPIVVFRLAESDVLKVCDTIYSESDFQIKKWKSVTNRIGVHDWAQGNGFLIPRLYSDAIKEYLTTLKRNNMQLEYMHLECYPNWGLDGPKYYIMSQLFLFPEANPDELLRNFCKTMFGEASEDMYNYFNTLEQFSRSVNNKADRIKMWKIPQQLIVNANELVLLQKAKQYIHSAMQKKITEDEAKRISLFNKTFQTSFYYISLANKLKVYSFSEVNEMKIFIKNNILNDPMTFYLCRKGEDSNKLLEYIDVCHTGITKSGAKK